MLNSKKSSLSKLAGVRCLGTPSDMEGRVDRVDMVKMHEVDTVDMVKMEPGSPAPRPRSPSGSSLLGERAGHYSGHYNYTSDTQGEQQLQPLQPDTQPPPLVLAPAKPRTVFIRYQHKHIQTILG